MTISSLPGDQTEIVCAKKKKAPYEKAGQHCSNPWSEGTRGGYVYKRKPEPEKPVCRGRKPAGSPSAGQELKES